MNKLNKNKYLIKLKLRNIWRKYEKCIYIGIPCIICLVLGIYFTYSKFTTKQEAEVVKTVVGDFISGDVVLAYSIDGVKGSDTFPKQNAGYEGVSVTCDNDATATWDNKIWSIKMTNSGNGKRVKCNVEFKSQETKTISGIAFKLNTFSPDFSKSACNSCESTESGVFAAEDDYGTSYYYRGSVDDNYVSFAGMIWRIIRINGDGSVRIILDNALETTSSFNSAHTDNTYVGYMGTIGASSYTDAHSNTNDSNIKKVLDTWYENNLKNYAGYLADSGFCNDRTSLTNNTTTGTGTTITYYNGYFRVSASKPSLLCLQSNDLFTTSTANIGNKALKYPIATITVDEVMLSGIPGGIFDGSMNYTKNSSNYLNINKRFWTMTPTGAYIFYGDKVFKALLFDVEEGGRIDDNRAPFVFNVRPVINLKADSIKSGNGEANTPYKVA